MPKAPPKLRLRLTGPLLAVHKKNQLDSPCFHPLTISSFRLHPPRPLPWSRMTRPVATPKPAAAPPVSGRNLRLDLRPYLIRGEDPAELEALTQAYLDQYHPLGATEEWLLRTMLLAQWNKQRWGRLETQLLDSAPDLLALLRDPASNALLKQVQRRLVSEDNRHFRSLAELRRLQKERTAVEPPAQQKEKAPVTENWVRSVKPPDAPAAFPPSPFQSGVGASAGQAQAAPDLSAGRTARAS